MRISHVGINVFSIQHCTKISWRGRIELVGRIPARKRIFRKKGNPAYGGAAGMKHPASSQLTSYVVVVRVNGSHLIKNYLITFLALISGAWLSLARAPRLPSLTFSFPPSPSLCLPRARSAHTTTSFNPLSPSSTVSCLLHLLLHPPSLLHFVHNVQPAAKSLSWFPFFFSLSLFRNPLARLATRQQSNTLASLSLFFFLSLPLSLCFSFPALRKSD